MRYRKGSRVEILSKEEFPSGSWRCAEIIIANGHTYAVRYDVYPGATDQAIVERVSRKLIRPCPPQVELTDDWIPGDVLEVFQNLSWKMATVSKVLGRNSFVVRLVGSSKEFKVRKSDLRVRQCWQNNEWIVIGKDCRNYEDVKQNKRLNLKYDYDSRCRVKQTNARMTLPHGKDHCFDARDNIYFQESRNISSRTLKRGSLCWDSPIEAHEGSAQKFRAAEKEGRCHRVAASLPPEKVEAICCFEMDVARENTKGAFGFSRAVSLEPNDADNITSSVGSCSVTSNSCCELTCYSSPFEDNEGHSSDAESFCWLGCEEEVRFPPTKEELAEEIHRLELHAYRCTIAALHASGPLSWEQETLVTDLRISLNISNDEHLMEAKVEACTACIRTLKGDIPIFGLV